MEETEQSPLRPDTQNMDTPPYTEFFSWGSDGYGQLALANPDEEDQQDFQSHQYCDEPKSLSFDVIITQISCGDHHAAFISGDGFLFSFGRNIEGQLGVGDPSLVKSSAPLLVDSLQREDSISQILQVSCGGNQTAVVYNNGDLFSWGDGQYGATGLGTTQNIYAPMKVEISTNGAQPRFSQISCGKRHSLALDSVGTVYITGDNTYRQLGSSSVQQIMAFRQLTDFSYSTKQVAAGSEHSLVLTNDGRVYSAGNNNNGNLGLGHNYSSEKFLSVNGLQGLKFKHISAGRHSGAITEDNKLFVWGQAFICEKDLLLPQELRSNKQIKFISIGEKSSAIIDEDSHLYTWGADNSKGQLGVLKSQAASKQDINMPQLVEGLAFKQVSQVSVGLDFMLALGLDYDQFGQTIQRAFNTKQIVQQQIFDAPIAQIQNEEATKEEKRPSYHSNNDASPYNKNQDMNNYNSCTPNTFKQETAVTRPPINYTSERYDRTPNAGSKPPSFNQMQGSRDGPLSTQDLELQNSGRRQSYDFTKPTIDDKSNPLAQSNDLLQRPSSSQHMQNTSNFGQLDNHRQSSIDRFQKPAGLNSLPQTPSGYIPTSAPLIGGGAGINMKSSSSLGMPGGATNVELYKQLDLLREENFQLKQKQRELQLSVNTVRQENEQLLDNAESEIKRMSDFIDKFTQDAEANKKKMIGDFESKLSQERIKVEEQRQKLIIEKNEQDIRMTKMQKEVDAMKQENMALQLAKSDAMQKQIDLFEQLEHTKQQLRQAQTQLLEQKRRDASPIAASQQTRSNFYVRYDDQQSVPQSVSKPPIIERQRFENYSQQLPVNEIQNVHTSSQNNSSSRKPHDSQEEKVMYSSYNKSEGHQQLKPITNTYEQREPITRYELPQRPNSGAPQSQYYSIYSPKDSQEEKKPEIRPVSSNYHPRFNYIQVQEVDQQNQQNDNNYMQVPTRANYYQPEQPTFSYQRNSEHQYSTAQTKATQPQTPINDENSIAGYAKVALQTPFNEEKEQVLNKTPNRYLYQMGSEKNSQMATPIHSQQQQPIAIQQSVKPYQPMTVQQSSSSSATTSVTGTIAGSSTLSDVKNRLLMMQKNKEELEEKLRRINRMPQY